MRTVFLGTGGGRLPPIGMDAATADIARRGTNAIIVQPDHPGTHAILIDAGADIRAQWAA